MRFGSKNKSKVLSDAVQSGSGLVKSDRNLIYEISNKLTTHVNELESKLNALQQHLGIEIVKKVVLNTDYRVIKIDKQ